MRVQNWPLVLAMELEAGGSRPFAWGSWDCFQFTARIVTALTGTDYRDKFPTYATEDEANRILAEHGGVQALIEGVLGPPKPPAFAQRGDVVLVDLALGLQPAICIGAQCAAPGPQRLLFIPMSRALAAWTV